VPAVVSDTGPLHYLLIIGHIDILPRLYGEVIVPATVAGELRHSRAPAVARAWAERPPTWLLVHPDPADNSALPAELDAGERAAIALALATGAELLLADDRAARNAARAFGLGTVGTIGILDLAARRRLLDLPAAVAALRGSNFRCSPVLFDALLEADRARRGEG
jgi:predicted nucleic acid-binding protein